MTLDPSVGKHVFFTLVGGIIFTFIVCRFCKCCEECSNRRNIVQVESMNAEDI